MTPIAGLVLAAGAGGVVAYRLGLFKPPAVTVPEERGRGLECAAPLLVGAFAVYCVQQAAGLMAAWLTGLAALPRQEGVPPPTDLLARTQLLWVGIAAPMAVCIAIWTLRQAMGAPSSGGRLPPARSASLLGRGVLWGVCTLPLVFAVGAVAGQVSGWLGRPVDPTAHVMLKLIADPEVDAGSRWMLITAAVVGAPVLEELCYRGLLQRGLAVATGSHGGAVLGTSVLFAVMHVGVIPGSSLAPALLQIFALSVVLGLLAAKTGTVLTSMVVHAMFNAVSIAAAVSGL